MPFFFAFARVIPKMKKTLFYVYNLGVNSVFPCGWLNYEAAWRVLISVRLLFIVCYSGMQSDGNS